MPFDYNDQDKGPAKNASDVLDKLDDDMDKRKKSAFGKLKKRAKGLAKKKAADIKEKQRRKKKLKKKLREARFEGRLEGEKKRAKKDALKGKSSKGMLEQFQENLEEIGGVPEGASTEGRKGKRKQGLDMDDLY